jgi:glycosyltransferase involved in cell wall biosynthesis
VIDASAALVTMTRTARDRLLQRWHVPAPVHVIPHGAQPNGHHPDDPPRLGPPVILTWGLIGPGKGIEWAIESLAGLRDLPEPPVYRIVGQTHPRVLEREGEAYRESLMARARALGVEGMVRFDDGYRDGAALRRVARQSDVILLPYDSRDQVTSGVLVEAVVAGKPVVSTAFPHARELLSDGAGLLVPQRDAATMGRALRLVLSEPALRQSMQRRARELAPSLHWGTVMDRFVELARTLGADRQVSAAS